MGTNSDPAGSSSTARMAIAPRNDRSLAPSAGSYSPGVPGVLRDRPRAAGSRLLFDRDGRRWEQPAMNRSAAVRTLVNDLAELVPIENESELLRSLHFEIKHLHQDDLDDFCQIVLLECLEELKRKGIGHLSSREIQRIAHRVRSRLADAVLRRGRIASLSRFPAEPASLNHARQEPRDEFLTAVQKLSVDELALIDWFMRTGEYRPAAAASDFGVSRATIHRWIRRIRQTAAPVD